ncbi:MAG: hypothetical protein K0V04_24655 [Deltaproteobacteria bacterium]|nr:hypothetical protein [Deltaproteobacteria bacterium]
MKIHGFGLLALGAIASAACDPQTPAESEPEVEAAPPRDNRVVLPADDDDHYIFVAGETVIEPGEDKTYCHHLVVPEDMALADIEMLQGEYGHHAVIVSTVDPLPPGSIEDCSDNQTAAKFSALLIPVPGQPEGTAFMVEGGTPVVVQSHYVNASDEPMLVRDAVRARRLPIDEVTEWISTFSTTNILGLEIPGDGSEATLSYDCELDRDARILYVTGHMHEMGTKFKLEVGPSVDELEPIYTVDEWIPEFRDLPPVEIYGEPLVLQSGTILRTSCSWDNSTGETVHYPEEMCVSVGVMVGTRELYECRDDR